MSRREVTFDWIIAYSVIVWSGPWSFFNFVFNARDYDWMGTLRKRLSPTDPLRPYFTLREFTKDIY